VLDLFRLLFCIFFFFHYKWILVVHIILLLTLRISMHWSIEINIAQVNELGCETNMAHFSGMMMIYTLALFWGMMMWWHSQRAGWQTPSQRIQPVLCMCFGMYVLEWLSCWLLYIYIYIYYFLYILNFLLYIISSCMQLPVLQWYQYNNYSNCLWILSWYHRNFVFLWSHRVFLFLCTK
jgi:hypothetical protein